MDEIRSVAPHRNQSEIGNPVRCRRLAKGGEAVLRAHGRLFTFRIRNGFIRFVFPFLQIATQFLNDALQVLNGRNFVAQWLGQLAGDAVGRYANRFGAEMNEVLRGLRSN
jgi:hypothetical protein